MPDSWEDVPLPESSKGSLRVAVGVLPFFLRKSVAVDDEVDHFTQNGGWRKLDKLFPLLRRNVAKFPSEIAVGYCEEWIACLRQFTAEAEVSDSFLVWRKQLTLFPCLLRSGGLRLR